MMMTYAMWAFAPFVIGALAREAFLGAIHNWPITLFVVGFVVALGLILAAVESSDGFAAVWFLLIFLFFGWIIASFVVQATTGGNLGFPAY